MSALDLFHESSRWALLLLLLVPWIGWRVYRKRKPVAMTFSTTAMAARIAPTWRVRMRWCLPALRLAALSLLILGLARPRKGNEQTRVRAEGIAIQLLVDRSGSMRAMDFTLGARRVDRLEAIKSVVHDFVMGGDDLAGRTDDMIGMIAFARYADSRCPLTLDHGYLLESLTKTEIVTEQEEDGTAIGDAVGLGVERLRAMDAQRKARGAQKMKSKVIILLTDGENNAGDLDPKQAAELAETFDIRIYTIGVGTRGQAPIPWTNPLTGEKILRPMQVSIDEETLREVAKATGGEYFRATDTDSLRAIYAEIDKMEKDETIEKRYYQYKELATQFVDVGPIELPPLLLCVFVLLALEMILAHTWLRQVP